MSFLALAGYRLRLWCLNLMGLSRGCLGSFCIWVRVRCLCQYLGLVLCSVLDCMLNVVQSLPCIVLLFGTKKVKITISK